MSSQDWAPSEFIGKVINQRFELLELIGSGGMSLIFKALDYRQKEMGEESPFIAVKVLRPVFQRDPRFWSLLAREAKKSQSLSHPNIVNVFDFDRSDDLTFMTMALLPGQSLAVRLENQTLPSSMSDRIQLSLDILNAVIYAHEQGVIHADLKPGNIDIAVPAEGHPLKATVFDFGLARALRQTASSVLACSPAYATPATITGQAAGPLDDAYGLGCVIYTLLAGKHPFENKPSNRVEAPAEQLRPVHGLDFNQWLALKQLILMPLLAPAIPHSSDLSEQDLMQIQIQVQEKVLRWLFDLKALLEPVKNKKFLPKKLMAILALGIFLTIGAASGFWWYSTADIRHKNTIENLIETQSWLNALNEMQTYRSTYGAASLNESTRAALLNGVVKTLEYHLEVTGESYNPVKAKLLLEKAQSIFPDSQLIQSISQGFNEVMIHNKKTLTQLLRSSVAAGQFCRPAQQNCEKGVAYYSQLLKEFHPDIFETHASFLLQSFIKAYAVALYKEDPVEAKNIRSQASDFFPADQLASLGMSESHDVSALNEPGLEKNVNEQVGMSLAQAEIEEGVGLLSTWLQQKQDIRTLALESASEGLTQWSLVYTYLVGFQSMVPYENKEWRALPLPEPAMGFFENMGQDWRKTADIQSMAVNTPSHVSTLRHRRQDPCQQPGKALKPCRDQFPVGAGPELMSIWLEDGLKSGVRLAVSRYELSWNDLSFFCQRTDCSQLQQKEPDQPVHQMPEMLLEAYLAWLQRHTGFKYRLMNLEEWKTLADPLELYADLVSEGSDIQAMSCKALGHEPDNQYFNNASVFQGTFDRYGLYNLIDLSPEVVLSGAQQVMVPGRRERVRRCRIQASAYEYPYAAYRLVRDVSD